MITVKNSPYREMQKVAIFSHKFARGGTVLEYLQSTRTPKSSAPILTHHTHSRPFILMPQPFTQLKNNS